MLVMFIDRVIFAQQQGLMDFCIRHYQAIKGISGPAPQASPHFLIKFS
jgi:hypothetical protein